jgi:hypothetical protein
MFLALCSQIVEKSLLPSSTIIRKFIGILENKEYMAMMKEKLLEIKRFDRNLNLSLLGAGRC